MPQPFCLQGVHEHPLYWTDVEGKGSWELHLETLNPKP